MHLIEDLSTLTSDAVESIEKLTLRWVFQAVKDFGFDAYAVFRDSPDEVKDIAEDITREILDRLAGYNIGQRLLGNVDYRKMRYIILPEQVIRQALFADSKAEKTAATATMQMSQLSLCVHQERSGKTQSVAGHLRPIHVTSSGEQCLSTSVLLHYHYHDVPNGARLDHVLHKATLCVVPNGLLQAKYNPNAQDSIWRKGRNAPSRGEDFRVRLSFPALSQKASWRVQSIEYDCESGSITANWRD